MANKHEARYWKVGKECTGRQERKGDKGNEREVREERGRTGKRKQRMRDEKEGHRTGRFGWAEGWEGERMRTWMGECEHGWVGA